MHRDALVFSEMPDGPGVYFFKRGTETVYVGKATSLRSRIRSYFDHRLSEKRSALVARAVADATAVQWVETDSVLEALIMEANLIRALKPVGNTDQKDDKSFWFIVVTKEKVPRVRMVRGRELRAAFEPQQVRHTFGPFTQGGSLKEALKVIRKIFPFIDAPFSLDRELSSSQRRLVMFNQSIGQYPSELGVGYRRAVGHIVQLFKGNKQGIIRSLQQSLGRAIRNEQFEQAGELQRQLFALTHIQDIALIKDEYRTAPSSEFRIEAYDVAHLAGESARGVMAVVIDGIAAPNEYRTFTVRTTDRGDDYAALKEILERRLRHHEWPRPSLMVIDGGRGHRAVAQKVIQQVDASIPLAVVTKDNRHKPKSITGPDGIVSSHRASILLANAEAHRFSVARHRRALRARRSV